MLRPHSLDHQTLEFSASFAVDEMEASLDLGR